MSGQKSSSLFDGIRPTLATAALFNAAGLMPSSVLDFDPGFVTEDDVTLYVLEHGPKFEVVGGRPMHFDFREVCLLPSFDAYDRWNNGVASQVARHVKITGRPDCDAIRMMHFLNCRRTIRRALFYFTDQGGSNVFKNDRAAKESCRLMLVDMAEALESNASLTIASEIYGNL